MQKLKYAEHQLEGDNEIFLEATKFTLTTNLPIFELLIIIVQ